MTWSPLACGIISGKYDGRVPPYSRASLKVDAPRSAVSCVYPTMIICASVTVSCFPTGCRLFVLFVYCVFVFFRFCNSVHASYICVFSAMLTPCTACHLPSRVVWCRLPAGVGLTHFSAHEHINTNTQNKTVQHVNIYFLNCFVIMDTNIFKTKPSKE